MATVCCSHALLSQVESVADARCQASAAASSRFAFASRKTVAPRSLKTRSLQTSFVGGCSLKTAAGPSSLPATACTRRSVLVVTAESGASIEFIRGVKEVVVPEVRLTRARDGSSGTATFTFEQPSVFDLSSELGDITGLYMIDNEGVIQCVDVSAKFMNGRPAAIEARYIMRSENEWDRFMRFMERYAEANGLGFVKK